jgi:hypothetical protein
MKDTICLQTYRKMIKIVTLIDSHTVLYWHMTELLLTLLFSLQYFSNSFTQPFTYSKFRLPNPFLFGIEASVNILFHNLY